MLVISSVCVNHPLLPAWLAPLSLSVSLLLSPITISFCKRKSTRLTGVVSECVNDIVTMTMLPTGWRSHHRSRLPFHILCHPVPPTLSQLRPRERFLRLNHFEIAIKELLALGFQNTPKPKPNITYICYLYITYIGVGVGLSKYS